MAKTSRTERHRRRESALVLVSEGNGFSDVVTAQMAQWGCSRSSAQRDCRWAHYQLQLGIDSHDAQHLIVHMATSLQRISLKAEEDLFSGSYSRLSLVFAPGWSSEFSVFRAVASQPRPEPWLSKSEGVGCEGCPVLSPASGDSRFTRLLDRQRSG